ncbi:MAG: tRNA 2-thiouridine(34) synthase MnmA [Gammaproteobacteria bacterium]|jgi:tRNA-specific 2-thiouridylase
MNIPKKTRVIVGLSGGVDSSVCALLLKQQGYSVEGLFMKNWEDDAYCQNNKDRQDAQAVCDVLNIPLHTVNFSAEYWHEVFEHFLKEYQAGRTPNPDVLCNQYIKFDAFLKHAKSLGADKIAMGHYARTRTTNHTVELLKGLDANKDQSYFLHQLNQAQLKDALFPVGELEKTKVRALAKQNGLPTHDKKDSTGICFIGERKFKAFLSEYLPAQPGPIATINGEVIGEHTGLMYYTLGQRQGLGIGGIKNTPEAPWYVIEKDLKRNVLIVAQGDDEKLYTHTLFTNDIHWISGQAPNLPLNCHAKIRYRQNDQACTISQINDHEYRVDFVDAQRAATPGQYVVFYQLDSCLGGGMITAIGDK